MIEEYIPLFDEEDYIGLYSSEMSTFLIEKAKEFADSPETTVDKEYHIALMLDVVDLIAHVEMLHSDLVHCRAIIDNLKDIYGETDVDNS